MTGPYATAAWEYRDAGWRGCLPLPPKAKAPVPPGWTGHVDAWPSNADIQTWIDGKQGEGNIALRLPPEIVGFDIDNYGSKQGGDTILDARDRWGGLPATWRSTNRDTGAGSILFFRVPPGLAWPGELGPGIELIQFAHRYAVVAPSIHPEGRIYRWISPDGAPSTVCPRPDDLPPLPDAWVYGITAGVQVGHHPHAGFTREEVQQWLTKHGEGDPCMRMARTIESYRGKFTGHGSRHEAARDAIRRITGFASDGHSGAAVALRAVHEWFIASIAADKDRPYDPHEWGRMVDGAVQLVGTVPVPSMCTCVTPLLPPAWTPPQQQQQHTGLLANVHNGEYLRTRTFPPLRYAITDLVPEGFTLLVGAPKIGKSYLVLDMALARAYGGLALGHLPVNAGPVFYLALEDGDRRIQARCIRLLGSQPIPDPFEYIVTVQPAELLQVIAEWIAIHRDEEPFVILDTLGKVMPPAASGETTYQRDYRIASELKRLIDAAPGGALIVNHHDRKQSAPDFIDAVSGTHGLAGAADTTIIVARDRLKRAGVLKVTGRDVREGQYSVLFDSGPWTLNGVNLEEAAEQAEMLALGGDLGDRSMDILGYVTGHPGCGPTEIADGLDLATNTVRSYLSRLVKSGRMSKLSRGQYALATPVASVASVANAESDESGDQSEGNTSTARNRGSDGPDAVAGSSELPLSTPVASVANVALPDPEVGPCARCGRPTNRYGPAGNPLCEDCREH